MKNKCKDCEYRGNIHCVTCDNNNCNFQLDKDRKEERLKKVADTLWGCFFCSWIIVTYVAAVLFIYCFVNC